MAILLTPRRSGAQRKMGPLERKERSATFLASLLQWRERVKVVPPTELAREPRQSPYQSAQQVGELCAVSTFHHSRFCTLWWVLGISP